MHAGIPGIGLSGLFFVISAFLMLAIEVWHTAKGESSLRRWRFVGGQSGIAAGIVVATVAMLWVLKLLLFGALLEVQGSGSSRGGARMESGQSFLTAIEALSVSVAPILGTFTLLLVVLCVAEMARWFVRCPKVRTEKVPGRKSQRD